VAPILISRKGTLWPAKRRCRERINRDACARRLDALMLDNDLWRREDADGADRLAAAHGEQA
jgi:hypothetical protein